MKQFTTIDLASLDHVHGGIGPGKRPARRLAEAAKPYVDKGVQWLKDKARKISPFISPRPLGAPFLK